MSACDECGHPEHEPGKCEVERGDGYLSGCEYMQALGPCLCGMVMTYDGPIVPREDKQ